MLEKLYTSLFRSNLEFGSNKFNCLVSKSVYLLFGTFNLKISFYKVWPINRISLSLETQLTYYSNPELLIVYHFIHKTKLGRHNVYFWYSQWLCSVSWIVNDVRFPNSSTIYTRNLYLLVIPNYRTNSGAFSFLPGALQLANTISYTPNFFNPIRDNFKCNTLLLLKKSH